MEARIKRGDRSVLAARTKLIENDPRTRAAWEEPFTSPIHNHGFDMNPGWARNGTLVLLGLILLGFWRVIGC